MEHACENTRRTVLHPYSIPISEEGLPVQNLNLMKGMDSLPSRKIEMAHGSSDDDDTDDEDNDKNQQDFSKLTHRALYTKSVETTDRLSVRNASTKEVFQ